MTSELLSAELVRLPSATQAGVWAGSQPLRTHRDAKVFALPNGSWIVEWYLRKRTSLIAFGCYYS